jgi:hypothetical protein
MTLHPRNSASLRVPARIAAGAAFCAIVASALGCGAAQAQTASTFSTKVDNFEVQLAGNVSIEPDQLDPDTAKHVVRETNYVFGDEPALIIAVGVFNGAVNFAGGVHDSFASFKCKTTVSDQTLSTPKGQGRAMAGKDCNDGYSAMARYYAVDKTFYQVLTAYRPADEDKARRFVESFKLLTP